MTAKTIPEGQGQFRRNGPPKMTADMVVIFDAWKIARGLPTFPDEDRELGFDAYCRKYGIIGPNKERSLAYRETSFSDQWPERT